MFSCVLIVPKSLVVPANELFEGLGWGPNNFSIPLTTQSEVTHYGLHTWIDQPIVDFLENKSYDQSNINSKISKTDFDLVMASLSFSIRTSMDSHFQEILLAEGLSQVQV